MPQNSLWKRFTRSIKNRGVLITTRKIIRKPFKPYISKRNWDEVFRSSNIEQRFTKIFSKELWGDEESLSGPGSTKQGTENLRRQLPKLIESFAIRSIFDAPCGDFYWMNLVLKEIDVDYVGGEIVKVLVDKNQSKYATSRISFTHINIIEDKFPKADLWICRDCLIHLSFEDTFKAMQRFIESGIPYVLTSTHKNIDGFRNYDIHTGAVRPIDLFSEPYHFDKNVLYRIDDWVPPYDPREMCLWSRDQIINSIRSRRLVASPIPTSQPA